MVKSLLEDTTKSALDWFTANDMQANPAKFQAIVLGSKSQEDISFCIDGHDIIPDKTVKLLGVEIDDKLCFKKHVSNICCKAGKQLSALARLSRILDIDTKLMIFNSFILSNFNYCPLVWHHCSTESTLKMEKIQERGIRFVYNDRESSYSELLTRAGKKMLYIDRLKKIAVFVYKCVKKEGPTNSHTLFTTKDIRYSFRDPYKVEQPNVNTSTFGLNSLRYSGSVLWNKLPVDLKGAVDVNTFKNLLKTWDGHSCKCGFCMVCRNRS